MNKLNSWNCLLLSVPLLLAACGETTTKSNTTSSSSSTTSSGSSGTSTGGGTSQVTANATTYPVVGTNQTLAYDNASTISTPTAGQSFYGQNANYPGKTAQYKDNGDGTVSDLVTGLMWQKTTDKNNDGVINYSDKMTYDEAVAYVATAKTGGHSDWRLPTIKELYSLIQFSGADASASMSSNGALPFIDTHYFSFGYGDTSVGERIIDAQYATSTLYTSTTMGSNKTMFGVNFADGRIKGYPTDPNVGANPGVLTKYYVLLVRGNSSYGKNQFVDNSDGTITDKATGLMWMKDDSGKGLNWQDALSYASTYSFASHQDWRLPDAKELQSIVDYTRAPATSGTAAIDPLFNSSPITNEAGATDYPFYWTSTTHAAGTAQQGQEAAYLCFGRCMGYYNNQWIDVHGAGAQRSDPKAGDASQFTTGRGFQGDAIRIKNYVRLVRNS